MGSCGDPAKNDATRLKGNEMPERIKDKLTVSFAIPAWSLYSALAIGLITAGMTLQKLDTLLANYAKTEDKVQAINEKQIGGLASIQTLQTNVANHESRLLVIERGR
jgi:hypothetical protein